MMKEPRGDDWGLNFRYYLIESCKWSYEFLFTQNDSINEAWKERRVGSSLKSSNLRFNFVSLLLFIKNDWTTSCKQLRLAFDERHIKFMKSNSFSVPRPQSDIVEYSAAVTLVIDDREDAAKSVTSAV